MNKREVKGILIAKGKEHFFSDELFILAKTQLKIEIQKNGSTIIAEKMIELKNQRNKQHGN